MKNVRIGTCSWADKTMIKTWYPRGTATAEARLRYYAAHFSTVEADSPFYAIPTPLVTALWAARTPPGFVVHVKAYGMLTCHGVDARTLPPELAGCACEADSRGRIFDPGPEALDIAFELFSESLQPLRDADKLGGILLQFPARFSAGDSDELAERLRYLDYCRDMLPEERLLIEFRHPSWVAEQRRPQVLKFLAERDMSFVSVDAPQFANHSTMPPLALASNSLAYVRMHGRNAVTYFGHSASAAERFDYLYTCDELQEWEGKIRTLAEQTEVTYVMFNNCHYDYAPRNAQDMTEILADIVQPPLAAEGGTPAGTAGQESLF